MTAPGTPRKTVSAGARGRVAAVHHQTRLGLLQAGAFTLAAVIATVIPHATGFWLPLHLFVLGGLLSAISVTSQMLAVTWSSAPPVPAWAAMSQRTCLAIGTIVLCSGRERGLVRLVEVGGSLVVVAVAALVPMLLVIRHGAVTDRFAPAIDGYVAATALGAVGTAVAVIVATGRASSHWVQLRDVHVMLNVLGLIGVVAAATLPYFAATQARRKMSARATPNAVRGVLVALVTATAVAAIGQWTQRPGVVAAALVVYAGGIVAIAVMLPIYGRRQFRWAGPRLVQLGAGMAWWAAASVVLAVAVLDDGSERPALMALVIGGFGQILVSSLAYLGPVLRGGGHEQLTAGFAITRSWVSLVAGNVAGLGAILDVAWLLRVALLVWVVDIAVRAVVLMTRRPMAATPAADGRPAG